MSGWDPRDRIDAFVQELEDAYGDDLLAVTLFGSVARGEASEAVSDVNLLVVLEDASPAALLRGAAAAREWYEEGMGSPLVVTWDEWRRSSDVFPIEVADMSERRRILAGDDPVDGLLVKLRHMRLQAEREIRGKLLHLREGMLLAADRADELGALLLGAAPSVATYLRAVLRLARQPVPGDTVEVARKAARRVGGDPGPFLDVWLARDEPEAFAPEPGGPVAEGVVELLRQAARYVDTLEDR